MTRRTVSLVSSSLLLVGLAVASSSAAPPEIRDWSSEMAAGESGGQIDQDRSVVWFGGFSGGYAVEGGVWDFTDGTLQGWEGVIPPAPYEGITRRVVAADFAGEASPMFPGPSTAQIWCGLHQSEAVSRGWSGGMGYGNSWCQNGESPAYLISEEDDITISFKYLIECEPGFDFLHVQILNYDSEMVLQQTYTVDSLTGTTGTPGSPATFSTIVPSESLSPTPAFLRLRFRFESDSGYSDEDGLYSTVYGAFSADDITFNVSGTPHQFTFESGDDGWTFAACGNAPLPSQTGVIGAGTYGPWLEGQEVNPCTLSGNVLESIDETDIVHNPPGRPEPQWEDLVSPIIDRGTHTTEPTTVFRFDAYIQFPYEAATFFRIAHTYSTDGGLNWTAIAPLSDTWNYLPGPVCSPFTYTLTAGSHPIPSNWNRLRVVIQLATDCAAFGVDPCTSAGDTKGSPLFDNIRVGLSGSDVRACCRADLDCTLTTEAVCTGSGGIWLSASTSCTPTNPCGSYLIQPNGSGIFPNIQAGVDAAFDNDELVLGDGTFTGAGNRDIDFKGKAITIRSVSDDPTLCTIDCEGMGRGFRFASGEGSASNLSGVTIVNGHALDGGAVFCNGTSPQFSNCEFRYNQAEHSGGALYCTGSGTPLVQYCIFRLNEAGGTDGGAACFTGGIHPTLWNCVFDHNVTLTAGGSCISTIGATPPVLDNSVIVFSVGCQAVDCGGETDTPVLSCCDVFGNEGGDWTGCIDGQLGDRNNFSADPLFCADGNPTGDYAVASESPCAPENNPSCGLVGVRGIGCATLSVEPGGGGEYPTIQAAADAASDGDVVLLEPGTYIERSSTGISMKGRPIIIRSQSRGRAAATIDCQGVKRGFIFDTGEGPGSMLDGLRIINGSELYGGAVLCSTGTSPTFHECIFSGSRAEASGGGICCWGGASPFIADCTFESDTAAVGGGGIALLGDASPRLDRCIFTDNNSPRGGGAYLGGSSGLPDLSFCTFDGNTADIGGGVYCVSGAGLVLRNCTIVRNGAPSCGGLYSLSTLPIVERTIIAYSTQGEAAGGSAITLSCSDLYGNVGGDWVGVIGGQSGSRGNFSLDPRFCDLPNGDSRIWNHSPCNLVACGTVGAGSVGCFSPMSIDPDAPVHSASPAVGEASAFPNPFTGSMAIHYVVPVSRDLCRVQVRVFDLTGRLIRTLMNSPHAPGIYDVVWDGRNGRGEAVPSGVYYCRVQINDWETTRSTLLVK